MALKASSSLRILDGSHQVIIMVPNLFVPSRREQNGACGQDINGHEPDGSNLQVGLAESSLSSGAGHLYEYADVVGSDWFVTSQNVCLAKIWIRRFSTNKPGGSYTRPFCLGWLAGIRQRLVIDVCYLACK